MKQYLGVTPPDDTRGCLQDIHWSEGASGYFPTYTLGNLYAAQFFEQARKDVGNLDEQFAKGEFAPMHYLAGHNHLSPALSLGSPASEVEKLLAEFVERVYAR